MKIVLLDAATMGVDIDFSPLEKVGEVIKYPNTLPAERRERIKDADVLVVNKVVLDGEVLSGAENIKLICVFAVGYNNIDISYCREHNIKVRNVPGYCTQSVCQHTFALLFDLIENMRYYDDFVKSGKYSQSGMANHLGRPFFEISGKKWGIIGMGAIGRAVADCAAAFGAEVRYSSVSGAKRKEKYENIPLDTLLRESDIISVHAPLNEKTLHLIGEREISLMKKTAVIINVGRGAVIDEDALARAVNNGTIAGCGLDVYSVEPSAKESPILNIKDKDRVIYTPHIAWSSFEARARCVSMTADNISAFINGESRNDVWQ